MDKFDRIYQLHKILHDRRTPIARAMSRLTATRPTCRCSCHGSCTTGCRQRTPKEQAAARQRAAEHARLSEMPEVKEAVADMLRRHYRAWIDQKIAVLGERTPREAMNDADGREAVAALVLQMEQYGARMQPPLDPAIIHELRETLGLMART